MDSGWKTLVEQAKRADLDGNHGYAETLWSLALQEAEDFEADEEQLVPILEGLGECFCNQGHFRQAEKPLKQVLEIRQRKLGGSHLKTGNAAQKLAVVFHMQQKYGQAEPLYIDAVAIKKILGPKDPDFMRLLEGYSDLLTKTQRQDKASELLNSFRENKKTTAPPAPFVSQVRLPAFAPQAAAQKEKSWEQLQSEIETFCAEGKIDAALDLCNQAVAIAEHFPSQDSRLARSLDRMGEILYKAEKYGQAEMAWWRSLQIKLSVLGTNHPAVAYTGNQLAGLHYLLGRFSEAESYSKKCQAIYEQCYGFEHPNVAVCLHNLASLYHVQGRYGEAEEQYKRAVEIRSKSLGDDHADTVNVRKNFADMLKTLGREAEAQALNTAANGMITGNWKVVVVDKSDSLSGSGKICRICKSKTDDEEKCGVCGAAR